MPRVYSIRLSFRMFVRPSFTFRHVREITPKFSVEVFPSTNCPYRGVKVTCFGKSVQVLTGSFLHLPSNPCKIIHLKPLEK